MVNTNFRKAQRQKAKASIMIEGLSGAGKTRLRRYGYGARADAGCAVSPDDYVRCGGRRISGSVCAGNLFGKRTAFPNFLPYNVTLR
jgi:hypothetical protein